MVGMSVCALPCTGQLSASLTFYAPGTAQRPHSHDHMQVSFLLCGELLERHPGADWTPPGPALGVKPAGLAHENIWGEDGVLMFTVKLGEGRDSAMTAEPGWGPLRDSTMVPELVRACVAARDARAREEALLDLIALPHLVGRVGPSPPAWLERAREAIRDEAETIRIGKAAPRWGVHRVRFSALFKHYYGLPPSVYRRRVLTARALARIAGGRDAVAGIAHDAGFADQAHLTRSMKSMTGFPPSRLRQLLG